VDDIVGRQLKAGIDVVSDGEMSKISYATYLKDRLSGFGGEGDRRLMKDLQEFPDYCAKLDRTGALPVLHRPACTAEIAIANHAPLEADLKNFRDAVDRHQPREAFMNAPSPGVVATFMHNKFYPTYEAYVEALAAVMQVEYEAIVDAGFLLQIDCPDLAMGRTILFADASLDEFRKVTAFHVEMINQATANIAPDRMRMHICWGNYPGPHHHDVPLADIVDLILKARPQAIALEAANPRHAHEWNVWKACALPDDKILIPGVISSTSNYIEHPDLIAQRLCQYAEIVGVERLMAGSDCGFSTFAGYPQVDPAITWKKFEALAEGAARASSKLT
ncbi:MAG: cobalamin-independent methionine synthase II family protein, partial [Verrucomicrobia bacterium]|nr:cobalamin-independent methionine synthase II family protein [Verrucomicrobiota bacterium]